MSSETIPEWAREEAFSLLSEVQMKEVDFTRWDAVASLERIALALLAAEQRGRKAGLEEAAKVAANAEMRTLNDKGGIKPIWGRGLIAAAIRSLGEKT